ncbi:MAG: transcriptional repressor NrdR [Planctomycetes bacterium]|nr:transcriptional repressor NrdR [Planctomycetota bacterium]
MRCPFCRKDNDRVVDSRSAEEGSIVRRRRECLACGRRFTTYEKVEAPTLYVIKKDGRRELFDREKMKRGILVACAKRPVPLQKIEELVGKIEQDLFDKHDREVRANAIGDLIMRELRRVDHVAYVRFASVYRAFKDVTEFIKELKPMLK